MSFGRILLGALVGGVLSSGAIIGVSFLGTLVPWWAILLIAIGGILIGGFVGGLLAQGGGTGAIAGLLSGIIVTVAVFLFYYFYYKTVILGFSFSDVDTFVADLLPLFGIESGTPTFDYIKTWITNILGTGAVTIGQIQDFVVANFIWFSLIVGAIFGGIASVTNLIFGLFGGLITRKKKESYDSYY